MPLYSSLKQVNHETIKNGGVLYYMFKIGPKAAYDLPYRGNCISTEFRCVNTPLNLLILDLLAVELVFMTWYNKLKR